METAASPRGPAAIDYGENARIGVIVPSGNIIAEPQIRAMLPAGVQAYFTRLPLRGSSEQELLHMASQVGPAAAMLADAALDLVIFHCTAVSTFSVALNQQIKQHIAQTIELPSFSTSDAIVAALMRLQARKVVLLTPYIEAVNVREVAFLNHHQVEVIAQDGLGIDTNVEMAHLKPEILIEQALRNRRDDTDAYFISCTAIRSAEVIAELEQTLDRPVITSNQVMAWHALRTLHIPGGNASFGSLFDIA
jgi:maleate isomerase